MNGHPRPTQKSRTVTEEEHGNEALTDPSRRGARRRLHGPARAYRQSARARSARAGQPPERSNPRPPLDQRRYRPAPRPVFRDDTIAVAESPVELRPGMREGQFRREDRARSGGPVGLRAGYEPRSDRTVT